jgi:hypothetical protein
MAAESTRSKTLGDGYGKFIGGGGETLTVAYEDGNIDWDPKKESLVVVYDRNDIVGSRKGKRQTGTITFTMDLRQFINSDTSNPTAIDVMEESGSGAVPPTNRAGWVSTGGNSFEQHLTGFQWGLAGLTNGDSADHSMTASKIFWEFRPKEGEINKIDCTGTILDNARPTFAGP